MDTHDPGLSRLLPPSPAGWEAGEDSYYDKEDLFNYINGGAELYISYGFKNVISRRYTSKGGSEIAVEIFDMVNSKNAFGVFTHVREEINETYGQGSQIFEDAILFWKSAYYVSVVSLDGSEQSRILIKDIAGYIDNNITGTGNLPGITAIIPKEGLVKESVLYFHHPAWINSLYYISDENILDIDDSTDCILAAYGDKNSRLYLLVVEYTSASAADDASRKFSQAFSDKKDDRGVFTVEDGTWLAFARQGKYFTGVFHAASESLAANLLTRTVDSITSQGH